MDCTTADLARRTVNALNYAYEATMNEYSQASINRAMEELRVLGEEAAKSGLSLREDLAVWSDRYGRWVARD